MNVTFRYAPEMEQICLKHGLGGTQSSVLTAFAQEALDAQVDFDDVNSVVMFVTNKISRETISPELIAAEYTQKWRRVETEMATRLNALFSGHYDAGNVTAYLTLGTRCPYNTLEHYYFVSMAKNCPIRTSIHELLHFYTHALIEPQISSPQKFNDFKEALTVLLNVEFADLIEEPDLGYPQHAELRKWIAETWQSGDTIENLATFYLTQ